MERIRTKQAAVRILLMFCVFLFKQKINANEIHFDLFCSILQRRKLSWKGFRVNSNAASSQVLLCDNFRIILCIFIGLFDGK